MNGNFLYGRLATQKTSPSLLPAFLSGSGASQVCGPGHWLPYLFSLSVAYWIGEELRKAFLVDFQYLEFATPYICCVLQPPDALMIRKDIVIPL